MMFVLGLPRVAMATTFIPFLNKQMLSGVIIRNGILLSFLVILLPWLGKVDIVHMGFFTLMGILGKELVIGAMIGFILAIPFWAIEGVGFFIDNQRGSTMASSLNPLTGSQTSTMGILLGQAAIVMFISSGGFIVLLTFLYTSYQVWPIDSFFPQLDINHAIYFIQQLDHLMMLIIVLSAPAIIAMFLSEFCFALVNRFAQQLNVFILSMPVKSAVALLIMVIYVERMFYYLTNHEQSPELLMTLLQKLIQ